MSIVAGILKEAIPVIKNLIPDPIEQAKLTDLIQQRGHELEMQRLQAEMDSRRGQLEINRQEAAHRSVFVAGWRPAVGWVCVAAFAFTYVLRPMVLYGAALHGGYDLSDLPEIDISGMTPVLLGMLGLGGLRTYEKFTGVAR